MVGILLPNVKDAWIFLANHAIIPHIIEIAGWNDLFFAYSAFLHGMQAHFCTKTMGVLALAWVKRHAAGALFLFTIAVVITAVIGISAGFHMEDTRLRVTRPLDASEGWQELVDGAWVNLPPVTGKESLRISSTRTVRYRMPADQQLNALCFSNQNVKIRATHNAELFYSFGLQETTPFGDFFGTSIGMMEVPESAAGDYIVLELSGGQHAVFSAPYVGGYDMTLLYITLCSMPRVFICALLLLLGVAEVSYAAAMRKKNPGRKLADFYYGVFVIAATVWLATDNMFFTLVIGNRALRFYVSVFALFATVPAFLLFLREQLKKHNAAINRLCVFSSCILLGIVLLSVFGAGVLDFLYILYAAHAGFIATIVAVIVLCVKNRREMETRQVYPAILVLAFFALLALVLFYLSNALNLDRIWYNIAFQSGLLCFCGMLGVVRMRGNLYASKMAVMSEYYKKNAYTDFLTGLGNYAACEQALEKFDHNGAPLAVLMLDLNNLKTTNDTHGHDMGDLLLQTVAQCMRRAFSGKPALFRIGGDEFIVLISRKTGITKAAAAARERFLLCAAEHNASSAIQISAACGCAVRQAGEPVSAHALKKQAEEDMYLNKQMMKAQARG